MRVVVAQDLSDDLGAFVEGPVVEQTEAEHGIEDAALHRLEPVACIRKVKPDDRTSNNRCRPSA